MGSTRGAEHRRGRGRGCEEVKGRHGAQNTDEGDEGGCSEWSGEGSTWGTEQRRGRQREGCEEVKGRHGAPNTNGGKTRGWGRVDIGSREWSGEGSQNTDEGDRGGG